MKRRGFLQLLGGAIAAPLMPSASFGAATKAAYPASALHAAIYHAQSRVNFSVFSLAQRLGLSLDQAQAVMTEMSSRGILGPLQGTTQAGTWARSAIWQRPAHAVAAGKVAKVAAKPAVARSGQVAARSATQANLAPFMKYLQDLCRARGMALHPQCQAQI